MARPMFIAILICLAGASAPARAQTRPDGQRVAEASCGGCHQIYGDRTSASSNDSGPSFQAISRMPSTTSLSLKVFLQSSHRNMPNLVLTPDEIDGLSAYILGLAPK